MTNFNRRWEIALKWLAILLGYALVVNIFSNTYDPDLGWHLRFGRDFWTLSGFPYLDTYTWTNFGQLWINHEWGGDALWWPVYNHLGYFATLLIVALAIPAAYIFAVRIFRPRITAAYALIIFLLSTTVTHIYVARLTMFTPLFFVLIWYTLERMPEKKYYRFWPIILWIWSALHGSWILGFIVIAIYITGNIFNLLLKKYRPGWALTDKWTWADVRAALILAFISCLALCLNPYGLNIWQEVISYFSESYFKAHITEWVPSYVYPIYWKPLLVIALAIPLVILASIKKRASYSQILLFMGFLYSGFFYKRNALLFVVLCAPVFAAYYDYVKNELLGVKKIRRIAEGKLFVSVILIFSTCGVILLTALYTLDTKFTRDIWAEKALLIRNNMPVLAVDLLKERVGDKKIYLFNDFGWGGYLNWTMPNALVFLDGRGAATWKVDGKNALKEYLDIKYLDGGLKKIEAGPSDYVLLNEDNSGAGHPDWINRLIFNQFDWEKILGNQNSQLRRDLNASKNWRKIYDKNGHLLWEKKT